jgi:hypothetical protein
MGLLNPLLLGLGLAAAVPLLLHLLQRHQGPRVAFPALRYLRRAEKESARRIRVRQVLLMMLRVAAVLLIALAAARPFLPAGGDGHSPTAVAIILDNSLSTSLVDGDERVLDRLRARALEVLQDAAPEDRFWLLRAGEPGEPALAGDAETTAMRVREVQPAAGRADLHEALERAAALLAAGAGGRAREIHLLTDLQAASFGAPRRPAADGAAGVAAAPPVIVYHPGTAAPANRGVTDVEVGGGMTPVAGQRTTVAAAIGGDGVEPANVRLLVNDRLVAAATASPGETVVLPLAAMPPGVLTGRVEIDADALHADDVRYFAARIAPPAAVAVPADQPFIRDALEVLAQADRIRPAATGNADVAFLPAGVGIETLGPGTAAVILPPEQPVQVEAVNRRLAAAGIAWRFEAPVSGEARFAPPADDPLLRSLEGVRLVLNYPIAGRNGAATDSVVLRLTDGTPWAAIGERRGGGRYVLLGSPLSPEASTLPTGVAMLPLMERLTGAWSMAQAPRTDAVPGALVQVPEQATAMVLPDGESVPVTPGGTQQLGSVPGLYRLVRGDSVIAAWAVNPPAGASELERLDRRGLEARLPGWDLHVTRDAAAFHRATFRERLGSELWRPLLLALLLVLFIEAFVAAAGRRRRGVVMAEAPAG